MPARRSARPGNDRPRGGSDNGGNRSGDNGNRNGDNGNRNGDGDTRSGDNGNRNDNGGNRSSDNGNRNGDGPPTQPCPAAVWRSSGNPVSSLRCFVFFPAFFSPRRFRGIANTGRNARALRTAGAWPNISRAFPAGFAAHAPGCTVAFPLLPTRSR